MRTDRSLAHRDADPLRLWRRHRALGWGAGALLVVGFPGAAWCQEMANDLNRWVPAFAVTSDILVQGADGFLQNNLPVTSEGGTGGAELSGSGSFTEPAVGGSLELMSPALLPIPGRPRLFAHGGFSAVFSSTVDLEKLGSPGNFEPPTLPPNASRPGSVVGGQGTKTSGEIDTLLVSAGVGLAFTFDVAERRFRLKPSFEYVREKVTVDGLLHHVEGQGFCPGSDPPVSCPPNPVQGWIFTQLSASGSETFHGIGAGLELEMDTVRLGPFMISLFLDGKATQLLGNRKIELAASQGALTATWDAELHPWLYRGGLGLRFRFVPER